MTRVEAAQRQLDVALRKEGSARVAVQYAGAYTDLAEQEVEFRHRFVERAQAALAAAQEEERRTAARVEAEMAVRHGGTVAGMLAAKAALRGLRGLRAAM
jgi:hypothetical protein